MSSPIAFTDWLPGWAQLLLLVAGVLLALAFMMMPFSVFGVKARLEALEDRLDEIQGEIRALSLRLPEPDRRPYEEPPPAAPGRPQAKAPEQAPARPPIPPAAWSPDQLPRRPIGTPPAPIRAEPDAYRPGGGRVEPRIDRGR